MKISEFESNQMDVSEVHSLVQMKTSKVHSSIEKDCRIPFQYSGRLKRSTLVQMQTTNVNQCRRALKSSCLPLSSEADIILNNTSTMQENIRNPLQRKNYVNDSKLDGNNQISNEDSQSWFFCMVKMMFASGIEYKQQVNLKNRQII